MSHHWRTLGKLVLQRSWVITAFNELLDSSEIQSLLGPGITGRGYERSRGVDLGDDFGTCYSLCLQWIKESSIFYQGLGIILWTLGKDELLPYSSSNLRILAVWFDAAQVLGMLKLFAISLLWRLCCCWSIFVLWIPFIISLVVGYFFTITPYAKFSKVKSLQHNCLFGFWRKGLTL